MSAPRNIGVFYSHGPHYLRVLRRVREEHPGARITALVPPGFPVGMAEKEAGEVLLTPAPPHSLRRPGAVRALLRQLRGERFDRLVVMFDSPRLRLLAKASGAGERWCCLADGRYAPLEGSLPGMAVDALRRRATGWATWLRIWVEVRFRRAG
ncbi:MAG: hypothetical protein GX580_04305 [Candidatus Hydrogenedens sp.]|nr:hypothetical protein [Candidatus Hydrogenedentota bacterium]NLF56841.1 hypothetical protein [Candidatus Hydrogenedens sp.]